MKLYSVSNIAAILIATCGEKAALALVERLGRHRIDVPKKVGGKLLEILGAEITAALVEHYAGCPIDAPSRGHVERIHRAMQLQNDVLESNLTANELAAKHGATSTYVRKLRAKLGSGLSPQTLKA